MFPPRAVSHPTPAKLGSDGKLLDRPREKEECFKEGVQRHLGLCRGSKIHSAV